MKVNNICSLESHKVKGTVCSMLTATMPAVCTHYIC